jgi:hypothetical protein
MFRVLRESFAFSLAFVLIYLPLLSLNAPKAAAAAAKKAGV